MSLGAAMAMQGLTPTGKSGEAAKAALLWVIVAIVVIAVILSLVGGAKIFSGISNSWHDMLQGLGLERDPEEQKIDQDATNADNIAQQTTSPFNPAFFKSAPAGTPLMISSQQLEIVGEIWNSVGFIYDNSGQALGAIKQCRNWAQVSQVANMFQQKKNRDMYAWMKEKFDTDSQRETLNKIVDFSFKLPKFS